MKTRLYVVDDHPLVLEAMQNRFSGIDEIELVGSAQSVTQALVDVPKLRPDVVILDLRVEGMRGVPTVKSIAEDCRGIVLFTSRERDALVERMLRVESTRYVGKAADLSDLDEAIRELRSHSLGAVERGDTSEELDLPHDLLSPREQQVYRLLVDCQTPKQIAFELGVAPSTAYTHIERVVEKLGLTSPSEVLRYALEFDIAVG